MLDLAGRTVVITGASAGIGATAASVFAERGSSVVIAARRQAELDKVAAAVRAVGRGAVHAFACDVASPEANEQLVKHALEKTGRLDVFVANAGITMVELFQKAKLETFKQVMDVNYFGTIYGFRAALPHVLEKKGQLAIVSSFLGKRGAPTRSGYSASKHALHGLASCLRCELLHTGVGVTVYCPGFVDTEIGKKAVERNEAAEAAREKGWTPEQAARALVSAVESRRRELVTPLYLRMVLRLERVLPGLVDKLITRRFHAAIHGS